MRRSGALPICFWVAIGPAISIYNYFSPVGFLSPYGDIAGTAGALLVVGSSATVSDQVVAIALPQ